MARPASNHPPATAPEPARPRSPLRRLGRTGTLIVGVVCLAVIAGVALEVVVPLWRAQRNLAAARAALADDRLDSARVHLEAHLRDRPESAEAHFLLARLHRMREKYAEFYPAFDRARELGWPEESLEVERLLRAAQQYGPTGDVEKRLHLYITGSHPEDKVLLAGLIRGYFNAHQMSAAVRWLDLWIARYPDDPRPYLLRGDVRFAFRNATDAIADFQTVIRLNPDHPEAHAKLGSTYLNNKQNEADAQTAFERQLQVAPRNVEALYGLAELAWGRGDATQTLQRVDAALQVKPDHVQAMCLKARALTGTKPEEALQLLRAAEKIQPSEFQVIVQLAQVLALLGQNDLAKTYRLRQDRYAVELKRATDLIDLMTREPKEPEHRFQVGECLQRMERFLESVAWYQSALNEDAKHIPSLEALANYYETRDVQPHLSRQYREMIAQIRAQPKGQ